ncbi:hypothetical protein [Blastococcus litoris]|uniref:hypothetical protein n=1 Tax=Blastococcus litoris TaxID=2171622 RepID=UPI000E3050A4|nr:hypothetical protein [Blastococcus litoris]
MTEPPPDPTLRVARPPTPGRAVRADVAAGKLPTPPVRPDEPTVTIDTAVPRPPHRTLEFGTPPAVDVTVGPRPRPRRRTWPWIVGLALLLLALGVVLLVMMLRGATIDGTADLVGRAGAAAVVLSTG